LLPRYKNVDFTVIDCKLTENYQGLFKLLNLNPSRVVVVANNMFDRKATTTYARTFKRKPSARSVTLPIGKGMEVTRIGTIIGTSFVFFYKNMWNYQNILETLADQI